MGIVKLGQVEYETREFRIANNCLFVNGRAITICEPNGIVQLKGEDVSIRRLNTNGFTLIEGSINSLWCAKWVSITGKVLKYWAPPGKKFFNNTAKESLSREKKGLRSKIPNRKRSVVTCLGSFSLVQIEGMDSEVWLKNATIEDIVSHGRVSVQGYVANVVARDSLYISRK